MPEHSSECYGSPETTAEDADLCCVEMKADESLKMSHQTIESLLLGVGPQLENEEYLLGISCRLQSALEKMLMVITDTSDQVPKSTRHISCMLSLGSIHPHLNDIVIYSILDLKFNMKMIN